MKETDGSVFEPVDISSLYHKVVNIAFLEASYWNNFLALLEVSAHCDFRFLHQFTYLQIL